MNDPAAALLMRHLPPDVRSRSIEEADNVIDGRALFWMRRPIRVTEEDCA